MLAVGCTLLVVLLVAPAVALVLGSCRALEVANGTVTSLPGATVTLICPGKEAAGNVTIHWVYSGSQNRKWTTTGNTLVLRAVQLNDTGDYLCFLDDHLVGTVPLLVDVPPEEPKLSCFRKNPLVNAICEWRPSSTPSPTTKAVLFAKKIDNTMKEQGDFQVPCQYSQQLKSFSCQVEILEGDKVYHTVSLCVANSVGSKSSHNVAFHSLKMVQPDPPANLMVSAIPGRPHWLKVSWQHPESWDPSYYFLKFQLRYRPEWSKTFTIQLPVVQYQYVIHDALQGVKHVVQVRGKEDLDLGQWSEWSPEVTGTPWIEPTTTPAVILWNPTQVSVEDYYNHEDQYGSSTEATRILAPVQESSSMSLSIFLVAGGSLVFGLLLCVFIILRLKQKWKSQAEKESKTTSPAPPPYSLGPLKPTFLLVPLLTPHSSGSDNTASHSCLGVRDAQSP